MNTTEEFSNFKFKIGDLVAHRTLPGIPWVVTNLTLTITGESHWYGIRAMTLDRRHITHDCLEYELMPYEKANAKP